MTELGDLTTLSAATCLSKVPGSPLSRFGKTANKKGSSQETCTLVSLEPSSGPTAQSGQRRAREDSSLLQVAT